MEEKYFEPDCIFKVSLNGTIIQIFESKEAATEFANIKKLDSDYNHVVVYDYNDFPILILD